MIYFIQNNGDRLIKIGFTDRSAESRQKDGETWAGHGLTILATMPGDRSKETALHRQFAEARVWPNKEWFRPTVELLAFIDPLVGSHPTPDWLLDQCVRRHPDLERHRDTWRWNAMRRIAALYLEDD